MISKIKSIRLSKYVTYITIALLTLLFGVLSVAGVLSDSSMYMLEKIAISIVLAVSLSMVVGFLGELSLGHAGFMCVGAYLGGKISAIIASTALGNGIITLIISLAVGGVCAGICGFIIGLPALRLKGDYLAIVTLAFGEIVRTIFQNTSNESFGGAIGLATPRYNKKVLFIIAFVIVLLTVAVIQNVIKSKHGRAITAIRDNEIAARATGINVTKYKLVGFIISSIFAGLAGVLFSYTQSNVSSVTFDYNYSIEILVMVVLGGMGSINGSIIAATLITFLNEKLSTILTGNLAVMKDMLYALILILVVIYNNAPQLRGFREKYNIRTLIAKFRKHDPSKDINDSGRWDVVPTKIEMNEVLSTDLVVKESRAEKGDREVK